MQVELVKKPGDQGGGGWEHDGLNPDPHLRRHAYALADLLGERDQGHRVEVDVVAQLLRHRVVFVVRAAPPPCAHPRAEPVDYFLDEYVDFDVS